jgi:hypothetical protein
MGFIILLEYMEKESEYNELRKEIFSTLTKRRN